MPGGEAKPRPRVLLVAEAANPEWQSVPLVGWSHCRALAERLPCHLVTQTRNREAIERAGWREGEEFTSLDSEAVARRVHGFGSGLRRRTGLGWTTTTALSSLSYYWFERLFWQRFRERIRAGEFDVVHRVTPLSPTVPSVIAGRCRRAGVPFVWGPINGGVPWPEAWRDVLHKEGEWLTYLRSAHKWMPGYRDTRANAAALVIASRATWDQMPERYRERCVYVPENAIDPERFQLRVEGPVGAPLRVAFVGRLVPYKGADVLLEAAAPLVRAGLVRVDLIGDGPQREELERFTAAEGLADGVEISGWLEHGEVQGRLVRSDVLGFPSIREFGGGVVLEAMALGLAPVVVDYGGPGELVSASTGTRIAMAPRAELVARFREELEAMALGRVDVRAIGARARERVFSLFTWSAKAEQTLAIYDWVLGRRAKPDFGMPLPDAAS